ncbi:MAG: restriction endonuclease subunit S [Fibrobacter sp.]|nr:restriction endonuclease subunit S [Fibrobacter sp.]
MKTYARYKDSGISWIGEIPEHWDVVPFREGFDFGKGLPITKDDLVEKRDNAVPVISYGQIHSKINEGTCLKEELLRYVDPKFLESNPQSLLKSDDVVFADTSEDLEGCGNCVRNTIKGNVFAGYHTVIARLKKNSMGQYLSYLFQSDKWRSQIRTIVNGVKVYSVTRGHLRRCKLLIPPSEEQKSISDYLDKKMEQINGLVATKQRQIELLKEYKQSLIANAVTKSINPKVKMKDSGINWIGMVPEHWNIHFLFQKAKEHYISNKNVHHQNLLSLSYGRIIQKDINTTEGLLPESFDTYQIVEDGNIVLRLTDLQNDHKSLRVGYVTQEGIITSAYECLEVMPGCFSKYLYYQLHSFDIKKMFYGMGGGLRQNLNYNELKKIRIAVPPFEEQKVIVEYIENRVSSIDTQISSIEKQIANLNEYKQSLISDVVTGKVKV